MFANAESVEIFLCGIAAYLIVAPLCLVTAGVCAWVLRQRDIARDAAAAGGGTAPVVNDHRRSHHGEAPAVHLLARFARSSVSSGSMPRSTSTRPRCNSWA